ncbi:ligand-gated ion channel [Kineosporia babensis]|uniref:Secreted protein n=1 Tax=Kineosporia babensis TaxID=499548 RepID=A0A9X1N9Z2_9ACTN|nr:hypothetical protein [Kineosporia babensis]MCD5310019.1 hypothetical protein [Kineosporia babensis]
MKKIFAAAALASVAVLAVPATAQAAEVKPAAVKKHAWKSNGLAGAQAAGQWWVSGGKLHVSGVLEDTAADKRQAQLRIRFSDQASAKVVKATGGKGDRTSFSFTAKSSAKAEVREIVRSNLSYAESKWYTIRG